MNTGHADGASSALSQHVLLNTADGKQTTASHFHFNKTIFATQKSHKLKCSVQPVTANKLHDQLMYRNPDPDPHAEINVTMLLI